LGALSVMNLEKAVNHGDMAKNLFLLLAVSPW
jgi:hypothetical protein